MLVATEKSFAVHCMWEDGNDLSVFFSKLHSFIQQIVEGWSEEYFLAHHGGGSARLKLSAISFLRF